MKTVILVANNHQGLKPLTDRTCHVLLPVGGKPLIEHAIESLYNAGIRDVSIVLDTDSKQVMDVLADGARWDMRLHYEFIGSDVSHNNPTAGGIVSDFATDEVLLVRGDLLWSLDVRQFIEHARETGQKQVCGVNADIHADTAVIMWTDGTEKYDYLHTFDCSHFLNNTPVRLMVTTVNFLDSLTEFHQANIDLINGKFSNLSPHGSELSHGLIVDFDSKVNVRSLLSGVACVGRHCNIHKSVQFEKNVVVGDRVLIDRGTRLENTVVLPDTYIGEMVTLKNTIIWGNTIIRIDTGLVMQMDDELLFADMGRSQKADSAQKLKSLNDFMFDESASSTR